ncbi:MAG: ABC transporter ATP-binding protein [Clostridia bacterium]|nr:ABC transporter ATP-binding protein [Clostridia bacterium]
MEKLLEVRNLKKYFPSGAQVVKAVDDVSFDVYEGETLGLVGESGCGKSTTGRMTIRLLDSTSGSILYRGRDVAQLKGSELRDQRCKMQIIFQDPFSSLDPRKTIGETIGRPLQVHGLASRHQRFERVLELMERVGLDPNWVNKYPHELDGGRRQRVGIARALAVNPEYIVCDEPVSALDVSIQAQVLNLLQDLQEEMGLTYLFISHDLSVVKHLSNRIAVMYLGKIVELATSDELFANQAHPYTQALLSAIPIPSIDAKPKRILLQGDVPSPKNPPSGCRFHTRCPYATERCRQEEPRLQDIGSGHFVACHLMEK